MNITNYGLIATAALIITINTSCSTVAPPEPVYPIPTQAQIEWQKLETYAFVHYGLCTYNDMEWGFGDSPASTFNPTELDVEQWAQLFKNAGMKGILMSFKHHDGFSLWPTKYSDYNISKSSYKNGEGDLVKELINACKKYDLKIGIYISPWDRNHAQYGSEEYVEYFHNQITEIVNEYCDGQIDLFEFWFDGANGGDGYYGGAGGTRTIDANTYYDYQRAKNTIIEKFPNAMIFGGTAPTIRWIGNEAGWAGQTNWSMWDLDAPESQALMYGMQEGTSWLPGEVDVSIRPGWFYHKREDHQLRSLGQLVEYYYQSVGRNANLLLNIPISISGKVTKEDSTRVMEWKKTLDNQFANNLAAGAEISADNTRGYGYSATNVNDGSWDSYWATEDSVRGAALTLKFNKPTECNTLLLQEYIALGQRIIDFEVEYKDESGKMSPIVSRDSTTTIGYKRIIRFDNITTDELKITFTKSRGPACINNVELFLAAAVLDEPSMKRTAEGVVSIQSVNGTKIFYTIDGSEPTAASTLYIAPFSFARKGLVRAIAFDPTSQQHSAVATRQFDITTDKFSILKPAASRDNRTPFDGDLRSSYYLPEGQKTLTFALGDRYNIYGILYTPDQSRWGAGPIHRYRILVDGKVVKEGEFSNIKHNPITRRVEFAPTKGSTITIEALSVGDNSNRVSVSEISVLTK